MTPKSDIQTGTQQAFLTYLNENIHKSSENEKSEYFHVDVVAEAWGKGFDEGKKVGQKEFFDDLFAIESEKFMRNASMIYLLSKRLIEFFVSKECKPCSLYINIGARIPAVIISVPDKFLLDDNFVESAYTKVFEIRDIYEKLYNRMLDIGLVAAENIDMELLVSDGFGYSENYNG